MTGVFIRRGAFEHRDTLEMALVEAEIGVRNWSQGISIMDDFHQKLGNGKEGFCPKGSNGSMVLLTEIPDFKLPEL